MSNKNNSSFRESTATKGKAGGVSGTSTHNSTDFNPTPKQAYCYLKLKDNKTNEVGYGGGA